MPDDPLANVPDEVRQRLLAYLRTIHGLAGDLTVREVDDGTYYTFRIYDARGRDAGWYDVFVPAAKR